MAVGAILLAILTGELDRHVDYEFTRKIGWFYSNKPDGARAILTTIAGSMMTVASVTFSITMVAVTSAAGQYGPRLIGNFMRDKANQVTLGTFTSTFVYCLLILRSARTGDSTGAANSVADFVPNISLLVAIGLTLISVAVMIFFIHHIPETLNVGNITGRVGRKLRQDLKSVFPQEVGEGKPASEIPDLSTYDPKTASIIRTHAEGYIQAVNEKALLDLACEHNCVLKLASKPGEFLTRGEPLLHVWPAKGEPLSESVESKLRATYALGQERTDYQNVVFLADQLIEILARALSPGVNDPFTAINCIHWLRSAISTCIKGTTPNAYRLDAEGQLRVIAHPISCEEFIDLICDRTRPYICHDPNVTRVMADTLVTLIDIAKTPHQKARLEHHVSKLSTAAQEALTTSVDREDIAAYIQEKLAQSSA